MASELLSPTTGAEETPQKPRFFFPQIQDNPDGWGPCDVPLQFKDTPYQPFSKDDRLGKVADWTNNLYQDRRTANKYGSAYGSGGQVYTYYHEQDDSSFRLVDSSRPQRPLYSRPRGRQMQNKIRRDREKREERKLGGRQQVALKKNREKERRSKRGYRSNYYDRNPPQLRPRAPSVSVKYNWQMIREITFPELNKLSYTPSRPEDLHVCGSIGYYNVRKEKSVSVRCPQILSKCTKIFNPVTTSDDPVIEKLAKAHKDNCKVFATDAILATLMTCTRSKYSWDIVVQRVSDFLFFDKRDDSRFEFLTVDETAKEPPQEETGINSPQSLALEATYINQSLSQQMLVSAGGGKGLYSFREPNPFTDDIEGMPSVAYRYRKYSLKDGSGLIVRCQHDAALPPSSPSSSPDVFLNIKTLNEWDPKYAGGNHVDWRNNLDRQRGAVFATELKNNSCKIAKWAVSAALAGSSFIKFGYVSRSSPRDSSNHQILGIQTERPEQLASQLTLDLQNAWGILHAIIDYCRELDPGKYIIMKDPNKAVIRIYSVPADEFDSGDSDDEESDGGAGSQSDDNKSD